MPIFPMFEIRLSIGPQSNFMSNSQFVTLKPLLDTWDLQTLRKGTRTAELTHISQHI